MHWKFWLLGLASTVFSLAQSARAADVWEKAVAATKAPKPVPSTPAAAPTVAPAPPPVERAAGPPDFERIGAGGERFAAQATSANQIMDDLFRTVAAVALDRAHARVAQRVIDTAKEALCDKALAEKPGANEPEGAEPETTRKRSELWPNSCEVLEALTPVTIGAAADALRKALVADVSAWMARQVAQPDDRAYLEDVLADALLPLVTDPGDVGRDDLLRLLNALVTHEWRGGKHANYFNVVFYVVRACALREHGPDAAEVAEDIDDCRVDRITDFAKQHLCTDPSSPLCEVLTNDRIKVESAAARLAALTSQRVLGKHELRRTFKELAKTTLRIVEDSALAGKQKGLAGARLLFIAMLEDDAFSFALQLGQVFDVALAGKDELSPKVKALLTAILAYAQTYQQGGADGVDPAARRKEVIEALVTAATDRSQRAGDWITSLGVNVGGYAVGAEWVDTRGSVLVPQLALPLGVFVQRKSNASAGFHAGAFFADLAQYVAFNKDGETTSVRWDSAIALGLQIGFIVGSIADPVVIGIDGRYAPTLFSESTSSDPVAGGTFRLGLFASYYVPFFDLN